MQLRVLKIRHLGINWSFPFLAKDAIVGSTHTLKDGDYGSFSIKGKTITSIKIETASQVSIGNTPLKFDQPTVLAEKDTVEIRLGNNTVSLQVLHLPGTDADIDIRHLLQELPEAGQATDGTTIGTRTHGRMIAESASGAQN